MAEVELQTGLEELLQLCQQQHETLTAALQRNFRQVSQGSCGSIRSTMSCQIAADLRTKKPELAMELVDEAPPLLDLEVLSNHSSPGAKGRENSRGAKDFDYTEHSFAVSEWSVSPADTTIKAVSHSRSNLIECSFGVNPLDGLTGWRYWRELTKMRIDYIAGVLVLLNSMMMIFELEIEGHHSGAMLGISEDLGFHSMERSFRFIDLTFVWIYLLELLARLVVEWPCFHGPKSLPNFVEVMRQLVRCVSGLGWTGGHLHHRTLGQRRLSGSEHRHAATLSRHQVLSFHANGQDFSPFPWLEVTGQRISMASCNSVDLSKRQRR